MSLINLKKYQSLKNAPEGIKLFADNIAQDKLSLFLVHNDYYSITSIPYQQYLPNVNDLNKLLSAKASFLNLINNNLLFINVDTFNNKFSWIKINKNIEDDLFIIANYYNKIHNADNNKIYVHELIQALLQNKYNSIIPNLDGSKTINSYNKAKRLLTSYTQVMNQEELEEKNDICEEVKFFPIEENAKKHNYLLLCSSR